MVKMGYIKQNIVQHIKENLTGYIIALVFFLIGVSSGCFYYKYVGDFFSDGFGRYMESYPVSYTHLGRGRHYAGSNRRSFYKRQAGYGH